MIVKLENLKSELKKYTELYKGKKIKGKYRDEEFVILNIGYQYVNNTETACIIAHAMSQEVYPFPIAFINHYYDII
ncbi:MAG: hypothetical protein SFY56_09720 [Bacteroidota bacterium]|nr:hypothetical protein [Bacteroidota bacterium]